MAKTILILVVLFSTFLTPTTLDKQEFDSSWLFTENNGFIVGEIRAFAVYDAHIVRVLKSRDWLECNGQKVTLKKYPKLFNLLKFSGTPWGKVGDNPKVPDLRGFFLRGLDKDGQIDPGAAERIDQNTGKPIGSDPNKIGSYQKDAFPNHDHVPLYSRSGDGSQGTGKSPTVLRGWMGDIGRMPIISDQGKGKETHPKNVYVAYFIYAGPTN